MSRNNAARGRKATAIAANNQNAPASAGLDISSFASMRKDNKDIIIIPKLNGNNY
jgi:hypothetical protein